MISFPNNGGGKSSKIADILDPNVIDENMILESVQEWQNDNNIITNESIQLSLVTELSLSFKSLKSIKNLDGLNNLVKLQLDNNNIVEIECIQHLVKLRWLDLSFNAIKEIKGLETLTELEDLSLFDNQIEKIGEQLENCQKLNVLSIGNNELQQFEEIIQIFGCNKSNQSLRFRNLQVLNVRGNPFARNENDNDYRHQLIVNLPGLKYLDYTFIDEAERNSIFEQDTTQKFSSEAFKSKDYIDKMQNLHKEEEETKRRKVEKEEANMHILDDLHSSICDNEDLRRFRIINENMVDSEIQKFKTKVSEILEEVKKKVIEKNQRKSDNQGKFLTTWKDRIQQSEKETIEVIRNFEKQKKRVFRKFEEEKKLYQDEEIVSDERLQPFKKLLQSTLQIKEELMAIEVQLVEELEGAITDFNLKQGEINSSDIDPVVQAGQQKVDASITEFQSQLQQIGKAEQDKLSSQSPQQQDDNNHDEIDEEDERHQMLEKDQMSNTINTLIEAMKDKGVQSFSKVTSEIANKLTKFNLDIRLECYERNRKNIEQIFQQIQKYNKEIQDYIDALQPDSEGER